MAFNRNKIIRWYNYNGFSAFFLLDFIKFLNS